MITITTTTIFITMTTTISITTTTICIRILTITIIIISPIPSPAPVPTGWPFNLQDLAETWLSPVSPSIVGFPPSIIIHHLSNIFYFFPGTYHKLGSFFVSFTCFLSLSLFTLQSRFRQRPQFSWSSFYSQYITKCLAHGRHSVKSKWFNQSIIITCPQL